MVANSEKQLDKQDHKTLVIWSANCPEHVLPYFENMYPEDDRPRKAIEAGRAWVRGDLPMVEAHKAAFASHTAARDAKNGAAQAAALSKDAGFTEIEWQAQRLPKHLHSFAFMSK